MLFSSQRHACVICYNILDCSSPTEQTSCGVNKVQRVFLRPLHCIVHTDWNRRVDTCEYQVDAEIAASTETRAITLEAWRNILPNTIYLLSEFLCSTESAVFLVI